MIAMNEINPHGRFDQINTITKWPVPQQTAWSSTHPSCDGATPRWGTQGFAGPNGCLTASNIFTHPHTGLHEITCALSRETGEQLQSHFRLHHLSILNNKSGPALSSQSAAHTCSYFRQLPFTAIHNMLKEMWKGNLGISLHGFSL